MINIPEGLPEAMADYIVECESQDFIPSAEEFEQAFSEHPELDWWMDTLQLPELRQELTNEADDEIFSSPRTLHDEMRERGLKMSRDFL